jgi:hypothetical protein
MHGVVQEFGGGHSPQKYNTKKPQFSSSSLCGGRTPRGILRGQALQAHSN